jgi:hypothetical protein
VIGAAARERDSGHGSGDEGDHHGGALRRHGGAQTQEPCPAGPGCFSTLGARRARTIELPDQGSCKRGPRPAGTAHSGPAPGPAAVRKCARQAATCARLAPARRSGAVSSWTCAQACLARHMLERIDGA